MTDIRLERNGKGQSLQKTTHGLILLHGRGGNANDMLALASHLTVPQFTLLAPQAPQHRAHLQ